MDKQLLLFQENVEDTLLRKFENLHEEHVKNRKSLHAKNGELKKLCMDLLKRVEILENGICSGKISTFF